MKKYLFIEIVMIIIFILPIIIPNYTYADISTTINPNDWKPTELPGEETEEFIAMGNVIVNVIRTIGIVVTVVTLMIMGIKYMAGSIQERAEYKKSMKPYLIGVLIFFGISQIIIILMDVAKIFET